MVVSTRQRGKDTRPVAPYQQDEKKKTHTEEEEPQPQQEAAAASTLSDDGGGGELHASPEILQGTSLVDSIADIFEKSVGNSTKRNVVWHPEISLVPEKQQEAKTLSLLVVEKHGNSYQTLDTLSSRKKKPERNASKEWFDLPSQEINDEVKTELRVLRLRSAFDPKQFYKKFDETKFPSKFQFGRVVETAADFYSSRLTNKQRKRTMAEEIMSDPHLAHVRKKRYSTLQEKATSSSSYFSRKTSKPRIKKKSKRSKH